MISGRLSGRAIVYSGYSGGTVTELHRVPFIELSLCVPVAQVRQPTIFTVKRTIPKTRDFSWPATGAAEVFLCRFRGFGSIREAGQSLPVATGRFFTAWIAGGMFIQRDAFLSPEGGCDDH
jgi:hypothetical protein